MAELAVTQRPISGLSCEVNKLLPEQLTVEGSGETPTVSSGAAELG
jgi:hypothetical protein